MLRDIFYHILYRPLFNALVALYEFLPGQDLGVAIVLLTILVRLALIPVFQRQLRSQRKLAELQPKIAEIQRGTKDRAEQSRRLLELYRHHGVSPASGCFPLLIQLPVLWGMFAVLRGGLRPEALAALYSFVPNPGTINPIAFGILHLENPAFQRSPGGVSIGWPAVPLALLTGLITYWQVRATPGMRPHSVSEDKTSTEQFAHQLNRQMMYFMPAMAVYAAMIFPAGLSLYWFVTTLIAVVQQRYVARRA